MANQSIIDGNFAFTNQFDHDFYKLAYQAEQHARTNFRSSGHAIREAMERLMKDIIADYHIGNYISRDLSVNKKQQKLNDVPHGMKYKILRRPSEMRAAGILPSGNISNAHTPLPFLGSMMFQMANGQRANDDTYEFLRMLGNTCSHSNVSSTDVKLSYSAILSGIKSLYKIAVYHWGERAGVRPGNFDEYIMPIENYHVTGGTIPHDIARSRC